MRLEHIRLAADLGEKGESFATARVVRRRSPSSARVGDFALITVDGVLHGWIGGACTRVEVIRHALQAIADGRPRLLSFSPDAPEATPPGTVSVPMTCQGGGSVEIFVEPVLPAAALFVYGSSPVAVSLARLGVAMGYRVTVATSGARPDDFPGAELAHESDVPAASTGTTAVVVATMGTGDEMSLRAALRAEPSPDYVAMICSATRFARMRDSLAADRVDTGALDRIHVPAGLDIGARTPQEIGLSVLAQIVARRRAAELAAEEAAAADTVAVDVDPVCGMAVAPEESTPRVEHEGHTIWFCCEGCRERFTRDPRQYAVTRQ